VQEIFRKLAVRNREGWASSAIAGACGLRRSGSRDCRLKVGESRRYQPIPNPLASSVTLDEAGLAQDLQVVADGRLALAERSHELANTHLALRRGGKHRKNLQADWVSEGGETPRQLSGPSGAERRVEY
jgi:hypothetical protein